MINAEVTILGGGPVGCFLAVLLNRMGVSNVLIERDDQPYQLPRAIVMDDEIQRIFHDYEMGEWLTANTSRLENADFVTADGAHIMGAAVPELGMQGLPPVVVHYQPDLDAMLRDEVVSSGSITRFGHIIVGMVDHGDHFETTLDDGEIIHSRWFVGCDGASSWTRRHVGLTLEDLSFDQEWLVVDVELNDEQYASLISFCFNLGCKAFVGSTLLKLINDEKLDAASKQFGRWNRAGGKVVKGLTNRRDAEMRMFVGQL